MSKKIKTLNQVFKIANKLKKHNKKIVTTNGVFDIIHPGHVKYLEKARRLGDVLIVAVNSDKSVKMNKGPKRPINGQMARCEILAGLESVDYIFVFNEKDPRKWISRIKPDIHAKAGDYKINEILEKTAVEENNGKIKIINFEDGHSTTRIIKKILGLYKK